MRDIGNIRSALELALVSISPSIATAWENVPFQPVTGVPYQKANILFATPLNSEFGSNFIEQGIFQVTLMYPLQQGTAGLVSRALLIRSKFERGSTHIFENETVVVMKTPEISAGRADGDRWAVPVKVVWQA